MCGIVGFYKVECEDCTRTLEVMRDTLTHRGPDDAGIYLDRENGVGLGHRRLSIIDLSALGHQPMSNEEKTVWLVYNGEVYNYREIREELSAKGYKFRSNTDTEVVLNAYLCWGIECIEKFIGMFAMGIWDKRVRKLYLIRDRLGIKPLYYYHDQNGVIFGSELKALMAHPAYPKNIDYGAMPNYLSYGYIPAPATIFENTFKLRQGHYLCIDESGVNEIEYWNSNDHYLDDPLTGTEDEIAEELEELLLDSFRYRLLADVPLGIFLSGGIDSTTLTALLQKNTNTQHKTFTIGFYEDEYDEGKWAKKIAEYLDTEHTEYYVSVDDCKDVIGQLADIYDEPFGDNSGLPTYLVSKLTKQNATVALSSDGGDELFGGYNRYRSLSALHPRFHKVPEALRDVALGAMQSLGAERAASIYSAVRPIVPNVKNFGDKYRKYQNMLGASHKKNLLEMFKSNMNRWTPDEIERLLKQESGEQHPTYFEDTFESLESRDFMTRMMATDLKTFLADDILAKVDRASMAVSLESREPFLDHRLVEYVARIPSGLKCRDGVSKYILRKVLYNHVPRELVDRPKKGFTVPLADWLRGDLRSMMMDYLSPDRLKKDGIFDEKVVSRTVENFVKGRESVHKVWYILVFQMWKERWV